MGGKKCHLVQSQIWFLLCNITYQCMSRNTSSPKTRSFQIKSIVTCVKWPPSLNKAYNFFSCAKSIICQMAITGICIHYVTVVDIVQSIGIKKQLKKSCVSINLVLSCVHTPSHYLIAALICRCNCLI